MRILLILLLLVTPCYATDYYVKNGGDDSKNGLSDANAWATLDKVSNTASDGDTVYLKRGSTFTELFYTPKSFTIDAYGTGDLPIIDGENARDNCISASSDVELTISNIKLINSLNNALNISNTVLKADEIEIENAGNNCISAPSGSDGYIKNSSLSKCTNNGIYTDGASSYSFDNIKIFVVTDNDGITLHDGTGSANTIKNCEIEDIGENNIDVQSGYTGTTIRNNILSNSTEFSMIVENDAVIERNYINDSQQSGILLADGASDSIIRNNIIYDCGKTSGSSCLQTGTGSAVTIDNIKIINNTCYATTDTVKESIVLAEGTTDVEIKNNIFYIETGIEQAFLKLEHSDIETTLDSDYNLYFGDKSDAFLVAGDSNRTFAQWQSDFSQDANSLDGQDPTFRTGSFYIETGSPAIDAGVTSTTVVDDLRGLSRKQGDAFDIGAYELGGAVRYSGVTLNGVTLN